MDNKYRELDSFMGDTINKDDYEAIFLKAQELFGYISEDVKDYLKNKLNISDARIRGIIKYNSLREEPKGKYDIRVCIGTSCNHKGSEEILKEIEENFHVKRDGITDDLKISLNTMSCTGACVNAPVVSVNGRLHKKVNKEDIKEMLN